MSLSHLRLRAPTKTHLTWLACWFSGRRPATRPRHRLTLERCENRIAPATATLSAGVLTIDYTATGTTAESGTVTNDGTSITLTGDVAGVTSCPTGDVSKIVVLATGNSNNQALNFAGKVPFALSGGFQSNGVDTVMVGNAINVAGISTLAITAPKTIQINAELTTDSGNLTLSANQQAARSSGSFIGINVDANVVSQAGNITLQGRGGTGTTFAQQGIQIQFGSSVIAGGAGTVSVTGTAGFTSPYNEFGVVVGSLFSTSEGGIKSAGGNVTVIGKDFGGVFVSSEVSAAANGSILIQGTSRFAVSIATGTISAENGPITIRSAPTVSGSVSVQDASVTSGGGDISIMGQTAWVTHSIVTTGGTGSISVTGTDGAALGSVFGVTIGGNNLATSNGDISVNGNNTSVLSNQYDGVRVGGSAGTFIAGGNGKVTIVGSSAVGHGVLINGTIGTSGGDLSIIGITSSAKYPAIRVAVASNISTGGTGVITFIGDSFAIDETGSPQPVIKAGALGNSVVSIRPQTSGTKINLGGADVLGGASATLAISNYEQSRISAGTIQIGNNLGGPITVSQNFTRATGTHLSLTTTSSISFGASVDSAGGDITLNSGGAITQTAGTVQTSKGTLTINAPYQTATFNSLGNKATQLVIPATVTAIVNGSFDSTGFVQVDGTLGGTGSVGVTTVSSTGRIKPGSGGPGKLTTGNIVFNAGSVLDVQLNGASYSQLAVNGTVNLGGAMLQATTTGSNVGQQYRIVDNLGPGVVTGTFAGYSEGSTYATGSTQYRVSYKDGTGNDVTLTPPAIVSSVVFGDGTNQRSLVKQMIVNFSQPVNFTADAFKLSRTGSAGVTGSVGLNLNPLMGPTNSVTITFAGALTEFGSLVDGFYDLTLDATKVTNAGGSLDGDANGAFGGNYAVIGDTANKFFRLFGDSNGSGVVDLADFSALRSVFNLPSTVFDFDNDGVAGLSDFARFRSNFGLSP